MKRLFFLLILSIMALPAYGQHWKKLTADPSTDTLLPRLGEARVPYFIDSLNGFVFDASLVFESGQPKLYNYLSTNLERTTDGGLTWNKIHFSDSSNLVVTQMCFVSRNRGYVSTIPIPKEYTGALVQNSGGIFETFDFGDHWTIISPPGMNFTGVYAADNTVFGSTGVYVAADTVFAAEYTLSQVVFSRDDGKTWDSVKTKINGVPIPPVPKFELVYGNKDSIVATVWFKSTGLVSPYNAYNGNDSLYDTYLVYSTNLGRSWQSSLLDKNYYWQVVALYFSPHSCNLIRDHLDDQDVLNDTYSFLGAPAPYIQWDSLLVHRETGAWITGNSCVSYLSDASDGAWDYGATYHDYDRDTNVMFFRSTDGGVSWQSLRRQYGISPAFEEIDDYDFANMSVVGHGAVVYADSFGYTHDQTWPVVTSLWKTTDGGDGSLNASALAPQFSLSHSPFATGTDTLLLYEGCSPSLIEVYDQNIGCSYGKFDSISILGLDTSEYSVISTHHCSCQPMPDTSFISVHPKTVGDRDVTIRYLFTDDEYDQIDTSIHLTLVVDEGNGSLVGSPTAVGFDSSHPCVIADTLVELVNTGCDSIFLRQLEIPQMKWNEATIADSLGLPLTWPIIIPPLGHEILRLRFSLLKFESVYDTLVVWYNGDHLTKIPISWGRWQPLLVPATMDLGRVSNCLAMDTTIILPNTGCDTLFIGQADLSSADWSLRDSMGNPLVLPVAIPPNGRLPVDLYFVPTKIGANSSTLALHYHYLGLDSTIVISLSGIGSANGSLSYAQTLGFTKVSECDTTDSTTFAFYYKGCDSMSLLSVALVGNGLSAFSYEENTPLPLFISNGDSIVITVSHPQLSPSPYNGNIDIHYRLADGSLHDTLVAIALTISRTARTLIIDTAPIDLGTIQPCESRDTAIPYTNTSCVPVIFNGWRMAHYGDGFQVYNINYQPITIPADSTDSLHITFDGSQTGVVYDTVVLMVGTDADSVRRIPVQTYVPAIDTVNFLLSMPAQLSAGEHFAASVLPDRAVSGKGLVSVSGLLSWTTNDFDFDSLSAPGNLTLVTNNPHVANGNTQVAFSVSNLSGITLDPTKPIAQLWLRADLTDTTDLSIALDSALLNSGDPNYSQCKLATGGTGTTATLSQACGDSLFIDVMEMKEILFLAGLQPNPATDQVIVRFRNTLQQPISYELIDALGKTRLRGVTGDAALSLDVSPLAEGVYFFRAFTSDGVSVSREILILR